jgi:hypothetical protein
MTPDDVKEGLSPLLAEGLTSDPDEDLEQYKQSKVQDGETQVKDALEITYVPGTRVPVPRFLATDDDDTAWLDGENPDRIMRGAIVSHPPEVVGAIKAGHICLRCKEPHPDAFPLACDLCGYPMRERQATDFAIEFEGETHMGPSAALSQYTQEQDAAAEKAAFDKRLREGGSLMKGVRRG